VEKCRVRKSGRGYFVELHIEVNGKIPVIDGHRIAHQVEDRLFRSELQIIDTVVHVEPNQPSVKKGEGTRKFYNFC
jgi:divalent metal cation (Fe/Co/Zn/Cd) transporter